MDLLSPAEIIHSFIAMYREGYGVRTRLQRRRYPVGHVVDCVFGLVVVGLVRFSKSP